MDPHIVDGAGKGCGEPWVVGKLVRIALQPSGIAIGSTRCGDDCERQDPMHEDQISSPHPGMKAQSMAIC
jgi:hypothetical protein